MTHDWAWLEQVEMGFVRVGKNLGRSSVRQVREGLRCWGVMGARAGRGDRLGGCRKGEGVDRQRVRVEAAIRAVSGVGGHGPMPGWARAAPWVWAPGCGRGVGGGGFGCPGDGFLRGGGGRGTTRRGGPAPLSPHLPNGHQRSSRRGRRPSQGAGGAGEGRALTRSRRHPVDAGAAAAPAGVPAGMRLVP